MRRRLAGLEQRYLAALQQHLEQVPQARSRKAQELGRQAMALGLDTLGLARVHEGALFALMAGCSAGTRDRLIKRGGAFFGEAITPIENTHRTAREANVRLGRLNRTLQQRSVDLAASNRQLKREIAQRRRAEKTLRRSKQHYALLLEQSNRLQEQLRSLSRQLLSTQEEERKRISRELHDEIAQILSGINIQLATLKKEASVNVKGLQRKIAGAQRMIEKSVNIVHRFVAELRPPALDILGLIPTLHSFVKHFASRTGVRARLTVFAGVKQLDSTRCTVLFRVAQEALTNVARHAQATRVDVSIRKLPRAVCMEIVDNGKSFPVQRLLHMRAHNHLGLLGMRERVEMVGGRFSIASAKGRGTTVRAQIPFRNGRSR